MPWRRARDPYKILISEVMLQQTQISRVLPKYEEFLQAFPSIESLAKASDKKLLKVWSGLGYWRRAKYLKETAEMLVEKAKETNSANRGVRARRSPELAEGRRGARFEEFCFRSFPRNPAELKKLPGIGPYTARAIACFAFNNSEAFLDTNIRRVYLHFFFPKKENVSDKEILEIAQKAVWKKNPREWHYALFDYGAAELKNKSINKQSRHYAKQSKFENSFRSYRTKVVQFLLSHPNNKASQKEIEKLLVDSPYPSQKIIDALLKDKLIKKSKTSYSV